MYQPHTNNRQRKTSQPMLIVEPSGDEESAEDKGSVLTFLASRIHESFTVAADRLSAMGFLTTDERIAISGCIGDALEVFSKVMKEKVPSATEIEVPVEVAQEILRSAILHRRQGIVRLAQEDVSSVPISSEYLDLPDRDQDHKTLRELIEIALVDEVNAQQHYDNMLDVLEQMDIPLEMDNPNRKAVEEILGDEEDHEKILLRMLGTSVPQGEPQLALRLAESVIRLNARHSREKCMRCDEPPTLECLWFNSVAHAWFCDKHFKEWIGDEHGPADSSEIDELKETVDGVASKGWKDNPNPDIKSRFWKTAALFNEEESQVAATKIVYDDGKDSTVDAVTDRRVFRAEEDGKWRYQDTNELVSDPRYLKPPYAVARFFNEEELRAVGARARSECMECSSPPTREVLWANGKGHAWFCDAHFKKFSEDHPGDVNTVKEINDGRASAHFRDNTNPNITGRFDLIDIPDLDKTSGKVSLPQTEKEFFEELSALEHDQWVGWSKDIAKNEDISPERVERWKKEWVPYDELPESVKKYDREYAEKVIDVIKDFLPFKTSSLQEVEEIGDSRFWEKAWSRFLGTHNSQTSSQPVRLAKEEPFLFDPNSTENEGRWRLMDPKVFEQGSVRRWNIWNEIKAPGIQFVMGKDTRDNQWKPQAIRFKKPDWDEKKAAEWWSQNKGQFEREWTQANWNEWMSKHPGEISPDYAGSVSQTAARTGDLDMPRTLAIDLDGTILAYDGFEGIDVFGEPIDGAREALQRFKEDGWFIVIDTCRGNVPQVIEHLALYGIPFDSVNNHPFQPSTANPGKPMAEYRIDDSAIHFNGDWASIYDEVNSREHARSLRAMKVAWVPPVDKKIALQELSDDMADEEWLDILPHVTDGVVGDAVVLSSRFGSDTYRMIRRNGEYRILRNFDPVYRSGSLLTGFERVSAFDDIIRSGKTIITAGSILRDLESDLLAHFRRCGFQAPSEWLAVVGTSIVDDIRSVSVRVDLGRFGSYNEMPVADASASLDFLKQVASDGAFAYDPQRGILLDFLDPFGNRTQPTDYRDPVRWGEPEELKKRYRRRRLREKAEDEKDRYFDN